MHSLKSWDNPSSLQFYSDPEITFRIRTGRHDRSRESGKYIVYIKINYNQGATTVVFDGYPEDLPEKSIKTAERLRRAKRHAESDVVFNELMTVTIP
ncbi:hypothetical protein AVEN_70993-1 [Araneus ventricosus]|uniref:Uncharacterized protein n=1 Tax=Araneus ventricosus TaxID=182803 RepID=A0A4Y2G6N0_ARAVE|nr:hypothetical protein AVEN_70993-1 [Araneus ventricosus]